jgi:integrase
MASLHRHSSGRSPFYFCKFRGPDGRVVVKSTKESNLIKAGEICGKWERAAQQAAKGALTEAQARKVIGEIYEVSTGTVLKIAVVDEWMHQWLVAKEATRAPGTVARYRKTIERFLKYLGPKARGNLANVTMIDVQKFRDVEIKEGVSAASADLTVKTLRIPFGLARRQELIDANPAAGVELLQKDGETRDYFTKEQIKAIIGVAEDEWKGVIRVGFYTGARLGNCARLRWSEIDWPKSVIVYKQEKYKRGTKRVPVVCPIHPSLLEDLQVRLQNHGRSEFVFPRLSGKSISGKAGLSAQFESIIRKAGIEIPLGAKKRGRGRRFHKLGYHSLKHSFVSNLANKQVPQEIRKLLVGHKSDSVNDIYTHLDLAALIAAIGHLPVI